MSESLRLDGSVNLDTTPRVGVKSYLTAEEVVSRSGL